MSRIGTTFNQADIARAITSAEQSVPGKCRVRIVLQGEIVIEPVDASDRDDAAEGEIRDDQAVAGCNILRPLLKMDEAAAELRVSRRWLQEYIKRVPCCYIMAGHRKLFDEDALEAIRNGNAQRRAKEASIATAYSPCNQGRGIKLGRPLNRSTGTADRRKEGKPSRVGVTRRTVRAQMLPDAKQINKSK